MKLCESPGCWRPLHTGAAIGYCNIHSQENQGAQLGKPSPGIKLTLKERVTLAAMAKVHVNTPVIVDKKFFDDLYEKLINAKEIIIT